jgi:nucleoside-diphosphate-sugar epimerase
MTSGAPVLVTGANGFIGRPLVRRLRERGDTVVAFDVVPQTRREDTECLPGRRIDWAGDIRRPEDLAGAIASHEVGVIVHLAGMLVPECRADPVRGAEVNVIGHLNVLEVARRHGVRSLVYARSVIPPRSPRR